MRSAPLLLALTLLATAGQAQTAAWRDATLPTEQRVAALLGQMTRAEKFWQLYLHPADSAGAVEPGLGRFGIQVRTTGSTLDAARQLNRVQRRFVERTRLGIPVVLVDEGLHGITEPGAVSYPQAIALAASWDTALVGEVAAAVAREARARGIRLLLSPVLNLASDARWGRVEETYGEDRRLVSATGLAFVAALERAGVVATPKHLVANAGEGGRDSYPIDSSRRRLLEEFLPPFDAAIRSGGAEAVMAAYNSIDGRPASASPWLLDTLLRQAWRFRGVTISDAGGVGGANVLHGTASGYADATAQALASGLDVIFQGSVESAPLFEEAVRRGLVPDVVLDAAVSRVLALKFRLGLFEHPYADTAAALAVDADTAWRALARRAAERSAVLLRNERGTLPLDSSRFRSVALIGVDAVEARLGGYAGPGRAPVSLLDALRRRLGAARVVYRPGPGRVTAAFPTIPGEALLPDTGQGRGLVGEYYAGVGLSGAPATVRRDPGVDFHWTILPPVEGLDAHWYSVRWRGRLVAPVSGAVRIGVEGNDGFRLFLDERLVVDRWEKRSYSSESAVLQLVRGRRYALRLEFREPAGNGRVRLFWDVGRRDDAERRIAEAVAAARAADVAVVVVGLEEGEFRDRSSLALPGRQEELIRRVAAAGKPVVVVIVGGGAVTMQPWLERVAAVLDVWYPGEQGGEAIAALLFGAEEPGGRLPITFPRAVGQLPLVYDHKPTGRGDDYLDESGEPLFPFGYGLGYTSFEYAGLAFSKDSIAPGDSTLVELQVRSTGARAGDEVVQLYLRPRVSTRAQPVMALKGFVRVHLEAGEARAVRVWLRPRDLVTLDGSLRPTVEPGEIDVMVGASARDIRLRGVLRVY